MLDEMSTQPDPSSYSERELTLKAISITSQRAQTVQRRLTAMRGAARDHDLDDLQEDLDEDAALPNPMTTDALLHHYLEQATLHQGQGQGQGGWRGLIDRALAPTRLHRQAEFNMTIVHALHQLDHRSRLQRRTLAELETETAALRRALSDLESRFHQQP